MHRDMGERPVAGAHRALTCAAAVVAALPALVALLGWGLGALSIASFGAGLIPMAPSTAVMILLYAGTVFLRARAPTHPATFWAGLVVHALGVLVAASLLGLGLQGIHPHAEHLGFAVHHLPGEVPIGHMSPLTAACFVLASLSFLTALGSGPREAVRTALAAVPAGLLTAASALLCLAYSYGAPLLYGTAVIPPALSTCIALLALGVALLGLASPHAWRVPHPSGPPAPVAYGLIVVVVALAAGIVVSGWLYHRHAVTHYREEVERQLTAIAELKVDDLVRWRQERLGDAEVLRLNAEFAGLVTQVLADPADTDATARLEAWLAQVRENHRYERVFLLDDRGVQRASAPASTAAVPPHLLREVPEVLHSGQVLFDDLHRGDPGQPLHLSLLVPISGGQDGRRPLALLVLRMDPRTYLYPLISRWPTPSQTAETILVRRDGDEVVFLNDLRFRPDAALNLRFPLSQRDLPAARAARGEEGIVEGHDYRGMPVVACLRTVPDSPWSLVARMDLAEIEAPLRQRLWLLLGVVGSLLLAAGTTVGLVWRQQSARYYRERYEVAEALRLQEERYRRTLDSMLEGCQILGRDWRYLYLNDAAARHGRRPKAELLGHTLPECYPGVERTDLFAALQRCMDQRTVRRIENEFTYPDGSTSWFDLSLQPVPEGVFVLSVDISERKRAEARLQHLSSVLRAIRNVNQLITREGDREALLRQACDILTETRGYLSAWVGLRDDAGRMRLVGHSGTGTGSALVQAQLEQGSLPECCRRALNGEEAVVLPDQAACCAACPMAEWHRAGATIAVALRYEKHRYGVLVASLPPQVAGDEEELSLFQEAVGDLAFALHDIELTEARRTAEEQVASLARFPAENPNPVLRLSRDGLVLYANPAAGVALQAWNTATGRPAPESWRTLVQETLAVGVPRKIEAPAAERVFSFVAAPVPAGGYVNLYGRDVTEQRRAEAALRESEAGMREVMKHARCTLWSGEVTALPGSDRAAEMVQAYEWRVVVEPDDQAAQSIVPLEVRPGKDYADWLNDSLPAEVRARKHATGLAAVRRGDDHYSQEFPCRDRFGQEHLLHEEVTLQAREPGRWRVFGVWVDVTERKQAEAVRLRLATAIEQAAEIVVITDPEGTIQYANPAFERATGYTRAEALGRNPRILRSGRQDVAFYRQMWETLLAGQPWQGRFINRRKDGTLYTEEATISPVYDGAGAIVNFVAVKRDITRELELESQLRQAQKLEAIGTLASGVAHEINNQVMGVMNYAQLIKDDLGQSHPEIRGYADEIVHETERVAVIVRNLLHFARQEGDASQRPTAMADIVESTLSLMRTVVRRDQIALLVEVPRGLPQVRCRGQQIQQVIMNLLTNARDALNEKYPGSHADKTIRVTARAVDGDATLRVRTTIEDRGTGIPEALRERIFEPFFTTKGRDRGTGLGLAISHGIAKDHGGQLTVESEVGQWTRFHLDLPAEPALEP